MWPASLWCVSARVIFVVSNLRSNWNILSQRMYWMRCIHLRKQDALGRNWRLGFIQHLRSTIWWVPSITKACHLQCDSGWSVSRIHGNNTCNSSECLPSIISAAPFNIPVPQIPFSEVCHKIAATVLTIKCRAKDTEPESKWVLHLMHLSFPEATEQTFSKTPCSKWWLVRGVEVITITLSKLCLTKTLPEQGSLFLYTHSSEGKHPSKTCTPTENLPYHS
jgi:hypothetical protein